MTLTALPLSSLSLPSLLGAAAMATTPVTADQLSWMSGYWLSCDGGRETSETWSDPRGGMLLGSVLTLEDGKISFEQSRIAPTTDGDGLTYFAGVEGAPPVIFPAIEASGTRVVFENAAHDFPQRVVYERRGDVLYAHIEGHMGDRMQAMDWTLQKADLNARCPS